MAGQRHRIRREVIALAVSSEAAAQRLHASFSGIHARRIAPVLDQCFTESSAPDRIHRIDRLVVDLGVIAAPDPAEEFLARLGPALSRSLNDAIATLDSTSDGAGTDLEVASQIELLTDFGRTGQVPWWADSSDLQLVNGAIERLTHKGPRQLVKLIHVMRRQRGALLRIVRHASDETLALLLGLLAESARVEIGPGSFDVLWMIEACQRVLAAASSNVRNLTWVTLMQMISETPDRNAVTFWREAVTRIAVEFQTPLRSLADALVQVAARGQGIVVGESPLFSALDALRHPLESGGSAEETSIRDSSWLTDIATILTDYGQVSSQMGQLVENLRQHAERVSSQDRRYLVETLQRLRLGESTEDQAEVIRHLMGVIARVIERSAGRTAQMEELRQVEFREDAFTAPGSEAQTDLTMGDCEADCVENAGLVLLWPFLKSLFERRGLVDDDRFVKKSGCHRACSLLGFLASGERSPAEYQMTLCKLLCGIGVAEVLDSGERVNDEEAEECTNLLMAAIGHATILREMSVDGFRGTFLIRRGVLTADTGAWLLRVERMTYDIVLDHFPWSWEWVKLPWMEAPLRVEW